MTLLDDNSLNDDCKRFIQINNTVFIAVQQLSFFLVINFNSGSCSLTVACRSRLTRDISRDCIILRALDLQYDSPEVLSQNGSVVLVVSSATTYYMEGKRTIGSVQQYLRQSITTGN